MNKKTIIFIFFCAMIMCIMGKVLFWVLKDFPNYNNQVQVHAGHVNVKEVTSESSNEKSTYMQYLQSLSKRNGKLTIAVIGSSVTKGSGSSSPRMSWASKLEQYLRKTDKMNGTRMQFLNYGFSGYKAEDLLKKGKVDQLIRKKPDFIIFETCIINNYRQSSPLADTNDYIDQIINKISRTLPNTEILIISPNPIRSLTKNKIGLTYEDYQMATKRHIEQEGYHYVNIHKEMNKYLENRNENISYYLADDIHPNDHGYNIWYQILLNYILNQSGQI